MKAIFERDSTHAFIIIIYLLLFCWQLNLYPGERFPEWDTHWGDVRNIGRIVSVARALKNLELPAVDPYMSFGMYRPGDLFCPLGPLYLLGLFLPPQTVLWLGQLIFMALAGIGSYFFLRRFADDKFICLLGGLTYVSAWANVGGLIYFMHHGLVWAIYLVPFALVLIHRVLQRSAPWNLSLFAIYCAFYYSSLDSHALLILPAVVLVYTVFVAWGYHGFGLISSIRKAVLLLLLSFLAGSIYLVPMYWNCYSMSSSLALLREAIPDVVGERGAWIWKRGLFETYARSGGLFEPMFEPTSTPHYGLLYLPVAFYLIILGAVISCAQLFKGKMKQVVVIVALLLLYPAMILETQIYWSPISKIFMSFRETATNIVGVPHQHQPSSLCRHPGNIYLSRSGGAIGELEAEDMSLRLDNDRGVTVGPEAVWW